MHSNYTDVRTVREEPKEEPRQRWTYNLTSLGKGSRKKINFLVVRQLKGGRG